MAKIILFCLWLFIVRPVISLGQIDEINIGKEVDEILTHYYDGRIQEAKGLAQELKNDHPREPFFRELLAEILWKELEKSASRGQAPNKRISYSGQENQGLAKQFYNEINTGLSLTQEVLVLRPNDSKNLFLRGMLLARTGGFIAKFENGVGSYVEADGKTAEGLELLKKSMALDPELCSAKTFLALTMHNLILAADESILNNLAIRLKSYAFDAVGHKYDQGHVFKWLDESMVCNPDYYWTKDVMWDKKFIYQDILVRQAGRMDDKALPVLEELSSRFPDNRAVKDNLFLVRLHIQNRPGPRK